MQYLRELRDSDHEQLLAWRNSPEVSRYMFTDRATTTEEHDRWFAGLRLDSARRYWVIHHGQRDLGVANLADLDFGGRRGSFGIYLADPAVRGRGLGTLAEWELIEHVFGTLCLETLCCEVLTFNTRMIALQERFGFVEQRALRRAIRKGDEMHEVATFHLRAVDWRQTRPRVFEQVLALEAKLAGHVERPDENP